jgi:hypothetical protein
MRHESRGVKVLRVRPRFELGTIFASGGVRTALSFDRFNRLLERHECGDWGTGHIGRHRPNEWAVRAGLRLDSHYRVAGTDVLVTTDAVCSRTGRRPCTTVYLLDEYAQVHHVV